MDRPAPPPTVGKPIELILTEDEQREAERAIRPLARLAQLVRRVTWAGTILLGFGFFLLLAIWTGKQPDPWRAMVSIAFAVAAFGLPAWALLVWKGTARIPLVELPRSDLSGPAQQLLAEVHRGAVRVLYAPDARPMWNYKVLPLAEARGPFSPLLLSRQPDIACLALWSMFGGYRYTILFEVGQREVLEEKPIAAPISGTPPPVLPTRAKRRADTHPVFFWPRHRFEQLVQLAGEQGLTRDHCQYLLEANAIALGLGTPVAAVELDRRAMTNLQKVFGKGWEPKWGTKVLRADYPAVWHVLGPLAAAAELESRSS